MNEENLVDSEVAAMMLSVSSNNLRQMVFRKVLTSKGRKKRKSLFLLDDIYALQKANEKPSTPPSSPESEVVVEQA